MTMAQETNGWISIKDRPLEFGEDWLIFKIKY
jgi:hypothetical protein